MLLIHPPSPLPPTVMPPLPTHQPPTPLNQWHMSLWAQFSLRKNPTRPRLSKLYQLLFLRPTQTLTVVENMPTDTMLIQRQLVRYVENKIYEHVLQFFSFGICLTLMVRGGAHWHCARTFFVRLFLLKIKVLEGPNFLTFPICLWRTPPFVFFCLF